MRWALLTLLLTTVAAAEGDPGIPARLSLSDALELFAQRGFDLLIAENNVTAAEADVRAAGQIRNPVASFGAGPAVSCFGKGCNVLPDVYYTASLSDGAAIEDVISGKRWLRLEVARQALASARQGRRDAERQLRFQVKSQFVELLMAQRSLRLAVEVRDAAQQVSNLVAVRYRAGAVSEADVARVETQRLEADQALDSAARDVRVSRAGLAFLLGTRGPLPEFEAQDDTLLKAGSPMSAAALDEPKLLGAALQARPDYRASLLDVGRTQDAARLARRNVVPEFSLSLQYVQQGLGNLAVQPPTFGVVLTSPLPLFYQQQGEIGRAEAEAREKGLLALRTRAQVNSEVDAAVAQLLAARRLVDRMEGGLLSRAVQARNLVLVQYQKGAASLLEYLDAQRTFIATHVEYLQNLKDYWTSVFRLDQAVGREPSQ